MEYVTNVIGIVDKVKVLGVEVKVIPNDVYRNFSVEEMKMAISPKTKLIMVTHVSSSAGCVLPVEEIGTVAEQHDILYLLDACQSVGQMPLDVKKIKCDMLAATGRKYLPAPRGPDFLFVRKEVHEKLKPVLPDFLAAGNVSLSDYELRKVPAGSSSTKKAGP